MLLKRISFIVGILTFWGSLQMPLTGKEQNTRMNLHAWPFYVEWKQNNTTNRTLSLGPFLEKYSNAKEDLFTLRPFYLKRTHHSEAVQFQSTSVLYPLFIYRDYSTHASWNILSLIRWSRIDTGKSSEMDPDIINHYKKSFEIFPFYFDYDSYNPDYDYFGVFPLWGELKNRLFHKRISWLAFPLYSEWERKEEKTYAFLWPIFRYRTGPTSKGFSVWPLWGNFQRDNDYHQRFALWPFLYYHQKELYKEIPHTMIGILPFYARETKENFIREDFIWPFFGYTKKTNPSYEEVRFLWPILIQGRGDNRYINQIAPIYSISKRNGKKSTWFLWPLFNKKEYNIGDINFQKFKFLYFLFQNSTQTITNRPDEFIATKRHLWPIFSYVKDHTGFKQVQMLSPLEPILGNNDEVRKAYSPLFSIFQYQELAPDHKDMNILFSLIHFERRPDHERLELGPFFGYEYGEKLKRVDLLRGLIGYKNENGQKVLRLFWFSINLGKVIEEKT